MSWRIWKHLTNGQMVLIGASPKANVGCFLIWSGQYRSTGPGSRVKAHWCICRAKPGPCGTVKQTSTDGRKYFINWWESSYVVDSFRLLWWIIKLLKDWAAREYKHRLALGRATIKERGEKNSSDVKIYLSKEIPERPFLRIFMDMKAR